MSVIRPERPDVLVGQFYLCNLPSGNKWIRILEAYHCYTGPQYVMRLDYNMVSNDVKGGMWVILPYSSVSSKVTQGE